MKFRQIIISLLIVGLVLGSLALVAVAQEERQKREEERSRRRLSMEERVERYMTHFKEKLGSTDEEWKVLEPKLKGIIEARFELSRLTMARFRGLWRLGRRRSSETQEEEEATPESQLTKLLQDESADADAIRAKLAEVRAASKEERKKIREKMKELHTQIAKQEAELKELLSIRQEALLVLDGVIS